MVNHCCGRVLCPEPLQATLGPGQHVLSQWWSQAAKLALLALQDLHPSASLAYLLRSAPTQSISRHVPPEEPLESLLVCWIFWSPPAPFQNPEALVRGSPASSLGFREKWITCPHCRYLLSVAFEKSSKGAGRRALPGGSWRMKI